MNCREFEKRLDECRDDAAPANPLREHAAGCSSCAGRLQAHARLMEGLGRLAAASDETGPSDELEQRLRRAFREREGLAPAAPPQSAWQRWGAVAAGFVLLVAAGIAVGAWWNAPAKIAAGPATAPAAADPRIAVGSDFIPIGGCLDPECLSNSRLLRVRMPRASLLHFGLPMNSDLADSDVLADVLVAEDGSAQAIRFVNYSSNP